MNQPGGTSGPTREAKQTMSENHLKLSRRLFSIALMVLTSQGATAQTTPADTLRIGYQKSSTLISVL
jgi:hypothetical protein